MKIRNIKNLSLAAFLLLFFQKIEGLAACKSVIEKMTVNGQSMSPLLLAGQDLSVDKNYYSCHKPGRSDIIVFAIEGRANKIVKKIFGVPGDKFEYKNNNIIINNQPVKNSTGTVYTIESKMLKLFAESYPVIPENSYLILGDNPTGSFDGSKFGFIDRKQIVGKVLLLPPSKL